MDSTFKRILIAVSLLVVFVIAVQLRFTGLDWALRGGSSPHPDERHVNNCVEHIYLAPVAPQGEDESYWEYWKRYGRHQLLEAGKRRPQADPPLKPVNYNYGTFPFYVYKMVQAMTADDWSHMTYPTARLVFWLFFAIFVLRFCWSMRPAPSRRGLYLKILPFCILLPILGVFALNWIPGFLVHTQGISPRWGAGTILVGRFVTALCGSLTVLVLYLIGRDAYGRGTGLLAAAFLAVAVLPVQLSHFCTVDTILAFWIVVAIFSFHRIALQPRLIYYILGAVASGFAIGTKWSAVTLPGMLFLAHAIGTWGSEEHGRAGRWIHSLWLLFFGAILLHFFRAASSTQPPFNITLAAFRDFYLLHRWTVVGISILLFSVSVFLLYCQSWWRGDGRWGMSLLRLYKPWIFFLVAVLVGLAALFVAEPLAFFDSANFARNVSEQYGLIVTGKNPAVYTQQYVGTMPIFYSLDNLFYPSLDWVTAFFALAGLFFSIYMAAKKRHRSDILFLAWILPNFLLYSTFLCKFPRYLITIIPFFLLFGARFLVAMASIRPAFYSLALARWPLWAIRGVKRIGIAGIALSLLCGTIYSFAYIRVYQRPHTYAQAADWLRSHNAENKRILSQSWDEWLPGIPKAADLELHTRGDADLDRTLSLLSQADYLVLPSKRAYGTTFRLPKRFPLTNRLFRLLFSEQLGYELAATITSEPVIGFGNSKFTEPVSSGTTWPRVSIYNLSWELSSDLEDESFRVYDHPKVVIFRNVDHLKPAQMRSAILNPPDWLKKVTWEDILRARAGKYILEPKTDWPALSWYLGLQVLSVCAFLFLFPLCSSLTDRGYGLSKILGLIVFSWFSWILASTGLFSVSRPQLVVVLFFMLAMAGVLGYRQRKDLHLFWTQRKTLLIGMEALFLLVWWIFLCIRAHHPDIFSGEKPMEFSFLNAIYRTSVFPPMDPWISGRPINYYYYGYVVYGLLGRLLAIPTGYLFNLGITTVPALLAISVFSLIHNICRSWKAGILGSYLVVFSGHLISYGRFIESYRQWMEGDPAATGFIPTLSHWFGYLPFVLKTTANLFVSALGIVQRAPAETLRFLHMHQGTYFWKCGHDVVRGTAANEFPVWSFYFSDFHPHVMVMPMTVAALGLALAFLRRRNPDRGDHIMTGADFGALAWFALVLGTIVCTNTWDAPGLVIALGVVIIIRFMTGSPLIGKRFERGPWFSPRGFSALAWDVLIPMAMTLILAWVLFVPFHHNFVPRVRGLHWMTEGNTPLSTMLMFFGILLWPSFIVLLWRTACPRGLNDFRWKRITVFLLLCIVSLALARYVNIRNPFHYPAPHSDYMGPGTPSDYMAAAVLFPFLVLSLLLVFWSRRALEERFAYVVGMLGLGILFGCEFVYLKEGWSEPAHRWNTVFKFYLQAWIYLGIFGAITACYFWRDLRVKISGGWRWRFRRIVRASWLVVTVALLLASIVFPIAGGFSVTLTDGADKRGPIPSLDGMRYMTRYKPDEYKALQFIRYALNGTPVVLEAHGVGREYVKEFGWVSWNTGCPTILGWGNHVHERLHDDEIPSRRRAVDRIYSTRKREEFSRLLGMYDVDYIYYGVSEHKVSPGCEKRWSRWGDILDVIAAFDFGPKKEHSWIYRVRKNVNGLRGMTISESPSASASSGREPGLSMFEGGPGFGNGQFKEPRGICVDGIGRVYVADTFNHRIQIFKKNGEYLGRIGEEGGGEGEFNQPMDVAVDQAGKMYVADTWNHRVEVFDAKGGIQNIIEGDFFGPRGIAVDPRSGWIYVTDTGHHMVKIFDPKGNLIKKIGKSNGEKGTGEGEFHDPVGIDVTKDGRVLVADTLNDRVQIFDSRGGFLTSWRVGFTFKGNLGVEAHLVGGPDDSIFVTDPRGGRVVAFNREGKRIRLLTRSRRGDLLRMPIGIAWSVTGDLFVTDLAWNKVFRVPIR